MSLSIEDNNSIDTSFNSTLTFNGSTEYGDYDSKFQLIPTYLATVMIDKYVTPLTYAVGFPGNIISLMVWIQKDMRHSSGCYLVALALTDFIVLCLSLVIELESVWYIPTPSNPGICVTVPVFFLASQYLSPLLVLGFTVERYISVCHPFKRKTFCTIKRAMIVISALTVLSLCMGGIQGYFYVYDEQEDLCGLNFELLVTSPSFITNWNLGVEVFIFILVPLTNLIINIMVIRELRRPSRIQTQHHHGRGHSTSATTVMLLAVSFYHIATTVPVTVVYSVYLEFPAGRMDIPFSECHQDPEWRRYCIYNLVLTIIKEWGTTRHAFNIFIYIIAGKIFREVMVQLLCRCKVCVFRFNVPGLTEGTQFVTRSTQVRSTLGTRSSKNS